MDKAMETWTRGHKHGDIETWRRGGYEHIDTWRHGQVVMDMKQRIKMLEFRIFMKK
jgi:hypothetical protein